MKVEYSASGIKNSHECGHYCGCLPLGGVQREALAGDDQRNSTDPLNIAQARVPFLLLDYDSFLE